MGKNIVCGENCPNYKKFNREVFKESTSEEIELLSNMFKI